MSLCDITTEGLIDLTGRLQGDRSKCVLLEDMFWLLRLFDLLRLLDLHWGIFGLPDAILNFDSDEGKPTPASVFVMNVSGAKYLCISGPV
jgi:hypothetical protein